MRGTGNDRASQLLYPPQKTIEFAPHLPGARTILSAAMPEPQAGSGHIFGHDGHRYGPARRTAMDARRFTEQAQAAEELPSAGWCVGTEQFRQELLQQMITRPQNLTVGRNGRKPPRRKRGEFWLRNSSAAAGMRTSRAAGAKATLKRCKSRATARSNDNDLAWIARTLTMGAAGSLANRIRKRTQLVLCDHAGPNLFDPVLF
jgi:hypothetical protein